jgi:CBS domain-containing protein
MQRNDPSEEMNSEVDAMPVKEIVEAATAISSEASIEGALHEMRSHGDESSAVTDSNGKLVGSVCKTNMNRNVGGLGHDPRTEPVGPQVDKDAAHCAEGLTIGEAEKVMRDANVDEVSVVNQHKVLVGKATLGAAAQKKHADKAQDFGTSG